MAINLEAIRAAGGIVHSDGNIFFRDISMLQGLAGAAPAAVAPLPAVLEQIAQGWDGCKYDAPGETLDIGADIRAAAKRLLAEQPAAVGPQGEWRIDTSAGREILVYKNCSVIEDADARYVLSLIAAASQSAAVAPQSVAAWMHPETLDVISDAKKHEMSTQYGPETRRKAEGYSVAMAPVEQSAAAPALEAPAHHCCNSWFLSLPEGRQAVLRENQWMLADAAYEAGRSASHALEAPAAPADDRADFEKWARQQSWIKDCQRYDDGRYGHCETEKAWATWQARAALAAAPQAPAAPWVMPVVQVHPLETAPKDGTIVQLLVQFVDHPPGQKSVLNGAGPLYDTADPCWTIGGNTVENTGVDHWQFVGWNWEQDCFVDTSTDSGHRVLGWAPFDVAAPAAPAVDADPPGLRDVGEALMETIERNADALKAVGWLGPMDCPSEIVVDLLNLLDEANTTSALGEWVATLEVDSGGGLDYETVPPCTLPPGCYPLYRAAQAKEGGAA